MKNSERAPIDAAIKQTDPQIADKAKNILAENSGSRPQ